MAFILTSINDITRGLTTELDGIAQLSIRLNYLEKRGRLNPSQRRRARSYLRSALWSSLCQSALATTTLFNISADDAALISSENRYPDSTRFIVPLAVESRSRWKRLRRRRGFRSIHRSFKAQKRRSNRRFPLYESSILRCASQETEEITKESISDEGDSDGYSTDTESDEG